VLPALLSKGIIAIHAVSETEIWVAGPDNLVRLRPEGPKPYFFPGRASSSGPARFWSSAPNDVWFARGALLARFDGAAWTAVDAGLGNNGLTALYGNAADDLFVAAGSLLRRFDGKQWTSFAVPGSGLTITDLAGNGRGTLWVASGSPATGTASVYRWNGLSYVALPGGAFGSFVQDTDRRLWVSPTGVVFTLFTGLDGCGWGGQLVVQKHDGVSWQDVATDKSSFACTVPHVANLTGTADNRVRWGAPWASAPMMYSLPSATTAFSATTTALSTEVNGVTLPRFLPGPQVACTSGAPDGKGGAWLSCGGQLARFDSGGVTLVPNPGTATVTNVFTAPSSSVWDTLSTGAIEQRKADGTVVTNGSFLGSVFVGLAGTSDSNVWAVTPDGGALHFDGAKWTSSLIPIGSSTKIVQVFAGATNAWARSSTKLYQWTAGTSGSAGSWAVVPLPGVEFPVDGVVWRDSLWVLSVDREFRFYSPSSGGGWTLQRRFSGSQPLLGASAAGPLTLSYSTAANTNDLLLEQWQTSGVVTLATIVDGTLGNGRLLLQPTAGSALFVNSDSSLQLAKF
jgi:hypothetical protein